MAGAYAALVSLINTIAMEKTARPSHPPIPFDGPLIDALLQRVEFLVEFLEQGCKGAEHLEGRIADLAFAAEDAIESPIVDQILGRPTSRFKKKRSLLSGRQDPKTILREMDSIVVEMRHIKDKCRMKTLPLGGPNYGGSSSAPLGGKAKMVGLEDEMIQLLEELERKQSTRQVISIVGMGGIGQPTTGKDWWMRRSGGTNYGNWLWLQVSAPGLTLADGLPQRLRSPTWNLKTQLCAEGRLHPKFGDSSTDFYSVISYRQGLIWLAPGGSIWGGSTCALSKHSGFCTTTFSECSLPSHYSESLSETEATECVPSGLEPKTHWWCCRLSSK